MVLRILLMWWLKAMQNVSPLKSIKYKMVTIIESAEKAKAAQKFAKALFGISTVNIKST